MLICPVEETDKHQSCKGTSEAVRCCGMGAGEEEGHQGNSSSGAASCSLNKLFQQTKPLGKIQLLA